MAALSPVFLDTSALLPGIIDLGTASEPAQRLMDAIAAGRVRRPQTAWHCCLEFFAVSTRLPEEVRLTPEDAVRLIEEEILGRFEVQDLPAAGRRDVLRAVARERAPGGRIYDVHIAETARRATARVVVTENLRHFAGLEARGVRVLTCRDYAESFGLR